MIFRLWAFWLLGLVLVTYIGSILLPLNANTGLGAIAPEKNFNYFLSLAQWDGGHFLEIAKNGYKTPESFAFFPLYPLLIRIVSILTKSDVIASLVISNFSFLAFIILFKKYLTKIAGAKTANTSVITFIFFPTTFFCILAYSESLFLMLTILAFLEIQKNEYKQFTIVTWLSTLTRLNGSLIIFSTLFLCNIKKQKRALLLLVSVVPFIVYVLIVSILSKNPLAPISAQSLWNRELSDPISTIFTYFWAFITNEKRPINDYFDFFITILFLSLLIINIKKIPLNLWIFSALVILLPLYTGTLTSMPRYALSSIGVYLILGKLLTKNENFKYIVWTISLATQCVLASLFVNGHWIA